MAATEEKAEGPAGRIRERLCGMAPANFAMVMGTGIVAVAFFGQGLRTAAVLLCLVCAVMWLCNAALLAARVALFPGEVLADAAHPPRAPGFLTLVAGTNVLCSACVLILPGFGTELAMPGSGMELAMIDARPFTFFAATVAEPLFWTGAVLWAVLVSGLWGALCAATPKKKVEEGVNGTWLLFTVSTQSVVVAATSLWGESLGAAGAFVLLAFFLLGTGLYFLIMPIILYRLMFKDLAPGQLSPTYWIDAGAMAITCLAGSKLAPLLQGAPKLAEFAPMAPVVGAMAAGAWAIAVFWVPALLLLELWRHVMRRYPFQYNVEYWSMVFPLGMLSACTRALAALFPAFGPFLEGLAGAFLALAAPVWLLVFYGLCRFILKVFWPPASSSVNEA